MTAEQDELHDLANEASEKLTTAWADLPLPSSLRKSAPGETDSPTAEIAELQEQLTAKSIELPEMLAKNGELASELRRLEVQSAAGGTVSDNGRLVAGSCARPSKRAEVARPCKDSFTTPSTAALPALLAERKDYMNRCETSTLENQ